MSWIWIKLISGIIFVLIPGFALKKNFKEHPYLTVLSLILGLYLLFLTLKPLVNQADEGIKPINNGIESTEQTSPNENKIPMSPSRRSDPRLTDSSDKWKYAWNMLTYEEGMGVPKADVRPTWAVRARLFYGSILVIVFGENPDPIVPTSQQLRDIFGDKLSEGFPREVIAHVPYQKKGDLIRYETNNRLTYSLLQDAGYGMYDSEYSKETHENVSDFLRSQSSRYRAISCYYQSAEPDNYADVRVHWLRTRPPEAAPGKLRERFPDHPFLDIKQPVEKCPSNINA